MQHLQDFFDFGKRFDQPQGFLFVKRFDYPLNKSGIVFRLYFHLLHRLEEIVVHEVRALLFANVHPNQIESGSVYWNQRFPGVGQRAVKIEEKDAVFFHFSKLALASNMISRNSAALSKSKTFAAAFISFSSSAI